MHIYSVDNCQTFVGGFENPVEAGLAAAAKHPDAASVIITELGGAVPYRIERTADGTVTLTEI